MSIRILLLVFLSAQCFAADFSLTLTPTGTPAEPLLYPYDPNSKQTFTANVYDIQGTVIAKDILITSGLLQNNAGSNTLDVPLSPSRQGTVTAMAVISFKEDSAPGGYIQVSHSVTATFNVVVVDKLRIDGVSGTKRLVPAGESVDVYADAKPPTKFPSEQPVWEPSTKGTVDPMNRSHFIVNTTQNNAEKIEVTAKCGSYDTGAKAAVVAGVVGVVDLATPERVPDLPRAECCSNVQPKYATCRWRAIVLPAGESAVVTVESGPVTLPGGGSLSVTDGTVFDVKAVSGGSGNFTLKIVEGDSSIGTVEYNQAVGVCFKFSYQVSGVTYTDTSSSTSSFTLQEGETIVSFWANSLKRQRRETASCIISKNLYLTAVPSSGFTGNVKCRTRANATAGGYFNLRVAASADATATGIFSNKVSVIGLVSGDEVVKGQIHSRPITGSSSGGAEESLGFNDVVVLDKSKTVYNLSTIVRVEMAPRATVTTTGNAEASTQEFLPNRVLGPSTVGAQGPGDISLSEFRIVQQ